MTKHLPPLFGEPAKPQAILHVLAYRVRLLSDQQAGRIWFPAARDPAASARAVFRTLAKKGLLALRTAMVHPELELQAPLVDWRPGEEPPQFGRLAFRLQARWHLAPERTLVARATHRARALWGAPLGGRPARAQEIAHDLGLATVFFRLLASSPGLIARWRHEDELVRAGRFLPGDHIPDAVLLGTPEMVVEFGGEYSAPKLAEIHAAYRNGPYQIW